MSIDVELNNDAMMPVIITGVAGLLAVTPRILRQLGSLPESISQTQISLAMFVLALVGAGVAESQTDGFVGFTFLVVLFGGYLLDTRERYEWMTMLVFAGVGVHAALDIASAAFTTTDSYLRLAMNQQRICQMLTFRSNTYSRVAVPYNVSTFQETALASSSSHGSPCSRSSVFSSVWLVVVFSTQQVTRDGFLTTQSNLVGIVKHYHCKSSLIWAAAHLATIWHFDQGNVADRSRLGGLGGVEANGFVGYYSALLTGIVAIIVSGMVAERWFTRAMTLTSLWILFQVGSWLEAGFWTNETFEESWAPLIWLAITSSLVSLSH